MCQAYEGERNFLARRELREIEEQWRLHESGEQPLSREQVIELMARKMMLEER